MNKPIAMDLKVILKKALPKAMSYSQYRELVDELVKSGDTTGETKTEAYIGYTQLNSRRMRRWEKTLKLDQAQVDQIQAFSDSAIWLVLTESWCGDAAPSLPVMDKIASLNPGVVMKVLLRDEHPELMDRFLTAGARSIPKLIMLDKDTLEVLVEWGPRPAKATAMVEAYKQEHGKLSPEFREELQNWYNKDKGKNTLDELIQLLALKEVGNGSDL